MQPGLEHSSCQMFCLQASPLRDHEPNMFLGLIYILFQSFIRPHCLIPSAVGSTGSPSRVYKHFPDSPRLCSHLFSGYVCLGVMPLLREDDVEDCVGAATGLIHVGGSHCAAGKGGQGGMTLGRGHWSSWCWGQGSFQDRTHDGKASLEDRRGLWEETCKSPGFLLLAPGRFESRKEVR